MIRFDTTFGVMVLVAACSAKLPGGGPGSNVSWVCTDTPVLDTSCRCQTSPIGGNVHIVDHCDATLVPDDAGAGDVVCCKEWIVLNGQRQAPFFCFCNPSGVRKCDTANGDELVDRCP